MIACWELLLMLNKSAVNRRHIPLELEIGIQIVRRFLNLLWNCLFTIKKLRRGFLFRAFSEHELLQPWGLILYLWRFGVYFAWVYEFHIFLYKRCAYTTDNQSNSRVQMNSVIFVCNQISVSLHRTHMYMLFIAILNHIENISHILYISCMAWDKKSTVEF